MKFKQIHGGMELVNDVEVLKSSINIDEIAEKCIPKNNILELTREPDLNREIILDINGVLYASSESFVYKPDSNEVEWIYNEFDLDTTDTIVVRYFSQPIK